jgi:ribonuclease BN (tRNA processing enzyme)
MLLTVLGSNGTYPTPGRPASGYSVETGSGRILLDCGPGVFAALLDRAIVPEAIVLSHGHGDHCLDLLPMFNFLRFDRIDLWGIPLLAPRGVVDRLAAFIGAGPSHPFFEVFVPEVVVPGSVVQIDEATLEFGEAVHPVPALCVGVTESGTSLVYSGDTGPGGDLAGLARGADLLLCEATHQGPPPPARYRYHLYAVEAGEIAATAGAAALLVTHVAPTLDSAVSVAEAGTVFAGRVDHAAPGTEVQV